jgi:hypothetical protein
MPQQRGQPKAVEKIFIRKSWIAETLLEEPFWVLLMSHLFEIRHAEAPKERHYNYSMISTKPILRYPFFSMSHKHKPDSEMI